MSDNNSKASGRGASNPPPPPPPARSLRLDPAAVMIGVGGVVLLLALWWLWATPRAEQAAAADEARIARIEQRLQEVRDQTSALAPRVQAIATLEQRLGTVAELDGKLRATEQSVAALSDRLGALDRRLQQVEARPVVDPNTVAPRAAHEQVSNRTAQLAERIEAVAARQQEVLRAADQRAADVQNRLASVEQSIEQRIGAATQQLTNRLSAAEQQIAQRTEAVAQQLAQRAETATQQATQAAQQLTQRAEAATKQATDRADAITRQLGERAQQIDQQVSERIAQLEQRLTAAAGQATRLAAIDHVRAALAAGQPLGPTLQRLQNPPPALARYATAAPPTEASLRLSFEDAVRAARAASDPAAHGPDGARGSIADTAVARLSGLVTLRRGDKVVWGNAIEEPIEKARRALTAGDLDQAVKQLETLPPEVREAMKGWTDQAKALLAARAALQQLSTAQG